MLEMEDTKGAYGTGRVWISRINDALDRLEFEKRAEDRSRVLGLVEGTFGSLLTDKTFVDLNDGLPAFEDIVDSTLPDVPPPDVVIEFPDEGPCDNCGGTGAIDTAGDLGPCPNCGGDGIADHHTDLKCESYLRMAFREEIGNVYEAAERAVWDDMGWGIGWVKTVWRRDTYRVTPMLDGADRDTQIARAIDEMESPVPSEDDNHAIHYQQHSEDIDRLMGEDPASPVIDELRKHAGWHESQLESQTYQHPEAQWVPADRMLYEPFAERWKDVGWYAELCTERLADLKKISGIKNIDAENLPRNETKANEDGSMENLPEEDARVDIFKIYDKRAGTWIFLPATPANSTGGLNSYSDDVKPILETEWPYPGNIYNPIVTRHPGWIHLHGLSSLALCENILLELARTNRLIRRHAEKHAQYKRIFPRGSLDQKANKTLNDKENAVGEIPNAAFAVLGNNEIKPPAIPEVLLQYRDILLNGLRKILGADNVTTGANNPHQQSATEVASRTQYHDARVRRKQRRVGHMLSEIGFEFLAFFKELGVSAVPVLIETPMGRKVIQFRPEDVPNDFRVAFDVVSATSEAKATKSQERQNYFQMLLNTVGDARKVMEEWGRSIDERDPTRLFAEQMPINPNPDMSLPGLPGGGPQSGQLSAPNLRIAGA